MFKIRKRTFGSRRFAGKLRVFDNEWVLLLYPSVRTEVLIRTEAKRNVRIILLTKFQGNKLHIRSKHM